MFFVSLRKGLENTNGVQYTSLPAVLQGIQQQASNATAGWGCGIVEYPPDTAFLMDGRCMRKVLEIVENNILICDGC